MAETLALKNLIVNHVKYGIKTDHKFLYPVDVKHLFLVAILASMILPHTSAAGQPFTVWLEAFKEQARREGISQNTLDAAFKGVEPSDDIITLDNTQPEKKIDFYRYVERIVSKQRVENGRENIADNRDLLNKVSSEYGIAPQFIVALWGIETAYGENQGDIPIIESLATLAYDGRRAELFRNELLMALKILDADHIDLYDFLGSWAGAMGQCQFMPSSYLKYAVDYNQDGKRDIWNTRSDVFASIANYLKEHGWKENLGWGMAATIPASVKQSSQEGTVKTLKQWRESGVRFRTSLVLPEDHTPLKLVYPDDDQVAGYLVTSNYDVLMKWNRSQYFATAVGLLADSIARGAD